MEEKTIIEQLKLQIKKAMDGEMTKEQYAHIAEAYFSDYGHFIENTQFYQTFIGIIPDLCLLCVDEPGDEDQKEREFRDGIRDAYKELKLL